MWFLTCRWCVQIIKRDSCVTLRERNPTTTREASSVVDHAITKASWSPNQQYVATLSAAPRIRLWNVGEALKYAAASDDSGAPAVEAECVTQLHGHVR